MLVHCSDSPCEHYSALKLSVENTAFVVRCSTCGSTLSVPAKQAFAHFGPYSSHVRVDGTEYLAPPKDTK